MAEHRNDIVSILLKKINDEDLTIGEQTKLDSWLQLHQVNKDLYIRLMDKDVFAQNFLEYYQLRINSNPPKLVFSSMEENINRDRILTINRSSRKRKMLWAAAASIITVVGLSIFYFAAQNTRSQQAKLVPSRTTGEEVMPAMERATLTLSDNRVIDLSSIQNGEVARDGSASIVKKDGNIVYNNTSGKPSAGIHVLNTPRGGYYHLTLADGTKVWINAASTISFPGAFSGNYRKVVLMKGEAYFEVARDAQKPFYVQTEYGTVEVLGTSFNVKNYGREPMQTTLISGSVRVNAATIPSKVELIPGQQATIAELSKKIEVENVKALDYISWKNGVFSFDNATIHEVMTELERWYDVDVKFKLGTRSTALIKGKFARTGKLSWLLSQLGQITNLNFNLNDKSIVVSNR
ncbi:FecR family protein [Pseudoflavitalea rhizosphaerae]|uniref:FecR family protein n=1 Tax=Pseudoflavitalea rhizosphaerae TaxID=1884793 RepID=UPI0013E097B0|nr:FecR family protein [Pseudoflavitalea rhizosphaerae]